MKYTIVKATDPWVKEPYYLVETDEIHTYSGRFETLEKARDYVEKCKTQSTREVIEVIT